MAKRPWCNRILALGLALSLSGCYRLPSPPGQSISSPEPDTSQSEPQALHPLSLAFDTTERFHPILTRSRVNQTLAPLVYEGLFRLDPAFTTQKVLCDSYSTSEDGLVWTFVLRQDITFSDGTPLTAAPVVRSLELARTADSPYSGRFSCVSSVTADDEHRLVITLTRPNTGLPALLDIPIVLGDGDHPLGTGPYVLSERTEDPLCLIPRSDGLDPIKLVTVSQTRQLTDALELGELSLVVTDSSGTGSPGFSGTYSTVDHDTTSLIYLGFNTVRSPFHSATNRTAAAAAVDRGALVSTAWSGHARATALPFHPASPLYDDAPARQLPSPNAAQDLIEQAGLTGRKITLLVNNENSCKVAAAQLLSRQLEKAGLSVTVSALPWSEYLSALSNGRFDLYLGEVSLTADFDLSALLSNSGSLNYSRWHSGECDRLLAQFLSAPEQKRPKAAGELCAYLTDQLPIAPLCFKRGSVLSRWEDTSQLTPTRANVFFGLF